MTQEDVITQLLDGKWHSLRDICNRNWKNIGTMYRRGELCKRKLFIPEQRAGKSGRCGHLKITVITQYRLHPEWLERYRRLADE